MNNFEKRQFLDYLTKLLPESDMRSYNFYGVVEFFRNKRCECKYKKALQPAILQQ